MRDKIVSIGLLTEQDLGRLGDGFSRHFPVTSDDQFADLLAKLDRIPFEQNSKRRDSGTQQ